MAAQRLLPETQELIKKLEDMSGFPVSHFEDSSLSVLATIKTGTQDSPIHVIRYRPGETAPDYQIAIEVGYALRTYARPPIKRFHLSSQGVFRDEITREVQHLNPQMDAASAKRLGSHLYDGLLLQLRSCPTGILVDLWIHASYPGLRFLQSKSIETQVLENAQCLAPELERGYPKKIVDGNRAMNAAHAFFASDLLGKPHLAIPYKAAGLDAIGTELLSAITKQPIKEIDDQELIINWAERLGIADWIKWLPLT